MECANPDRKTGRPEKRNGESTHRGMRAENGWNGEPSPVQVRTARREPHGSPAGVRTLSRMPGRTEGGLLLPSRTFLLRRVALAHSVRSPNPPCKNVHEKPPLAPWGRSRGRSRHPLRTAPPEPSPRAHFVRCSLPPVARAPRPRSVRPAPQPHRHRRCTVTATAPLKPSRPAGRSPFIRQARTATTTAATTPQT